MLNPFSNIIDSTAFDQEETFQWAIQRGKCAVCSLTESYEFRNIDDNNREQLNNFFKTNIQSGTICSTCYNEFSQCTKENVVYEEVTKSSKRKHDKKSKKDKKDKKDKKKHKKDKYEESDKKEKHHHKSKKSKKHKHHHSSHEPTDLSYLSSLKVSELQDQLRKYSASTKGSKAQLIQRLVRYICIFNNPSTEVRSDSLLTPVIALPETLQQVAQSPEVYTKFPTVNSLPQQIQQVQSITMPPPPMSFTMPRFPQHESLQIQQTSHHHFVPLGAITPSTFTQEQNTQPRFP